MKVVIVGAGLAGLTAARVLKDRGHDITVLETRNHIGGNCYDSYLNNILVHNYGPHIFHTNSEEVFEFISRFTKLNDFVLRIKANTKAGFINVPFNKTTEELFGTKDNEFIKDLIFKDYSEKQWSRPFQEIPKSITDRVNLFRDSYDDRYFLDKYQGIPEYGYTKMFENMSTDIEIIYNCDRNEYKKRTYDLLIYTGMIDEFYDYMYGDLEYNSLRFEYETSPSRRHCAINECNRERKYTRSIDHSHFNSPDVKETVISREYPIKYRRGMIPYYPMRAFSPNEAIFKHYKLEAEQTNNILFLGRLGTYTYMNMDTTIEQVLRKIKELNI